MLHIDSGTRMRRRVRGKKSPWSQLSLKFFEASCGGCPKRDSDVLLHRPNLSQIVLDPFFLRFFFELQVPATDPSLVKTTHCSLAQCSNEASRRFQSGSDPGNGSPTCVTACARCSSLLAPIQHTRLSLTVRKEFAHAACCA